MKKVVILLLMLAAVLSFCASAYTPDIDFDGVDGGPEWENADFINLISGDSHCNITTATVKYYIDNRNGNIYLCISEKDNAMQADDPDVNITLYAENDSFTFTPANPEPSVNCDNFTFDAKGTFDGYNGVTYEIKLGSKHGIPESYPIMLRFADSDGQLSNEYRITLINGEITTTSPVFTQPETTVPKTTKPPETATTKPPKTTKLRTTKATTVRETTVKKTEASTTVKITTSRAAETKAEKIKTTKAPKTKKIKTTASSVKTVTVMVSQSDSEVTPAASRTNLSAGGKYKTVIIASGTVALLLIAALGTADIKRKEK